MIRRWIRRDCSELIRRTRGTPLADWTDRLPRQLQALLREQPHGDLSNWLETLARLPHLTADLVNLDRSAIRVRSNHPPGRDTLAQLESVLKQLHPWRKGPYDIHGVVIETEWRSDWKWDRLATALSPLAGRRVLDVGCGNGYHCWRMAGAGAELVVGIDPTQLYLAQFLAIRHFLGDHWPVHLLPIGIDALPANLRAFDTVFSMGVLYHRRSPMDHLLELRGCLRSGGELVLETLVLAGGEEQVLLPAGRYAKMRNVWFIPSPNALVRWLERCGFREVRVIDVGATTVAEQRTTDWMRFESLADFLDPDDPQKTLEGYPAPRRAILTAISG